MATPQAIVEWFKGSSLQPYLSPLDAAAREQFLAAYTEKSPPPTSRASTARCC
jgi:trans-aconitate methyltransferase